VSQNWRPACTPELLLARAKLLAQIRAFFADKNVLEVETPLLCHAIGTDPQLDFFTTHYHLLPKQQALYLQTSPEFAMKRLLAAGSGSIYQICKAFRNGESGRYHNPEFTMLEWYRVGFGLHELMAEVIELIEVLFQGYKTLQTTQTISYAKVFKQMTGLDALHFCYQDYCTYALENDLPEAVDLCAHKHALWLDVIFSHKVQPLLGVNALCLVYGYPACQSSLARLNADNPLITDRVELFIDGIELGNGFYELTDAIEQNQRFSDELSIRQRNNLPVSGKDTRLLAALDAGLPACSGIAIGVDRLLMLLYGNNHIDQVLAFPISNA
jgi:lysyl-tRNA synthetase class 2